MAWQRIYSHAVTKLGGMIMQNFIGSEVKCRCMYIYTPTRNLYTYKKYVHLQEVYKWFMHLQ
jgi:hypothetical protein